VLKLIKDPAKTQAKNYIFAKQLKVALSNQNIEPTPSAFAAAFNKHYKTNTVKPHTVRKWLLGQTQPKSETLLLLSNWLKVDPKDLISVPYEPVNMTNKVSFEFDFTDQEVISKYLAMTVKEKITVRLLIDAIAEKQR
jgi:transcriptional regulator with XRE-family HTH domain